jgi:hypothetical protein
VAADFFEGVRKDKPATATAPINAMVKTVFKFMISNFFSKIQPFTSSFRLKYHFTIKLTPALYVSLSLN